MEKENLYLSTNKCQNRKGYRMGLYVFIRPSLRRDALWYTNVRLSVRPFHMSHSNLRTPWPIHFKFHRVIGIDCLTVCMLYGEIFIPELWDFIHQIVRDFKAIFRMSCCKLRIPLPIHFKLRIVIGIDSLMVCILFGEISIFHSRVMGLYSSNCRRFLVCRTVN